MRRANVLWATGLAALIAVPASAVEVKPYGFIQAQYSESIGRGNADDLVTSASSGNKNEQNQLVSGFSVRATRIGMNVVGGKGPLDSDVSGVIEADFNGVRNGSASSDTLAVAPRLRLAYVKFVSGMNTFTFGQDWDNAFAPLSPYSIVYVTSNIFHQAGNLWNRTPQARWDAAWNKGGEWGVNTKAAITKAFSGDEAGRLATAPVGNTATNATITDAPGSGDLSGVPALQALVEVTHKIDGRTFLAGVSAQYLRENFGPQGATTVTPAPAGTTGNGVVPSLLTAVHFDAPILSWVDLLGEGFYGHGGASQNGIATTAFVDNGTIRLPQTRGGWTQLSVKPIDGWRFTAGWGVEKIDTTGMKAGTLYQNERQDVGVTWTVSPEIAIAAEVSRTHSLYMNRTVAQTGVNALAVGGALAGDSEMIGLSTQYKF